MDLNSGFFNVYLDDVFMEKTPSFHLVDLEQKNFMWWKLLLGWNKKNGPVMIRMMDS